MMQTIVSCRRTIICNTKKIYHCLVEICAIKINQLETKIKAISSNRECVFGLLVWRDFSCPTPSLSLHVSSASLPLLPLSSLLFNIDMSCHWSSYLWCPFLVFFHWLRLYSNIFLYLNLIQCSLIFSCTTAWQSVKQNGLSTDMKKNEWYVFILHVWMFYSLFALYFLLSLVFFSCSFTPSLLELQPNTFSHNLFRPVCMPVCLSAQKSYSSHTHLCVQIYTPLYTYTYVQYRPHYTGPRDLCRNYFLFGSREKGEVVRMKYDVTTAVVFLCALLVPGCYPEFSFPLSLIDHVYFCH